MPIPKFRKLWGDYFDPKRDTASLNTILQELYRLLSGNLDSNNIAQGGVQAGNIAPGAVADASLSNESPAIPTSVSATTGIDVNGDSAFIDLTWAQPAGAEVKSWSVRWKRAVDTPYNYTRTGVQSVRLSNLQPNTSYHYQVQAISRTDIPSDWSPLGTITTAIDTTPPPQVTGLTAGAGLRNVTVYWTAVTVADLKHYELQIATNSTFTTGLRTFYPHGSIAGISDLTQGTTYWVRVRAIDNSDLEGDWSTSVSFVPGLVNPADIIDDAILGRHIADGAVAETSVADFAITYRKFNNPDHYIY